MPENFRKQVLEPKIYAVIARASQAAILHLGVHFTLEEAFEAARRQLVASGAIKDGTPVEMDLWSSTTAREVSNQLFDVPNVENTTLSVGTSSAVATVDKIVSTEPLLPVLSPNDIAMQKLIAE